MLRSVIRRCVELPVDLARRRMRSTALLLAASAPGLASAQTIANLQFDVDGVWPTSDSAWAYAASGGTPEYVTYPAVSGGVLQQRAFGIPDNGTYFMDGGLSDTNSYALEVRVEILSINGPLGTFFDFADGSHRYMVYFSDDGVYLRSDAGDVFVDSAIYQMRTYRLESCAGQATLFIDGVPMATAAAPTDARNFIQIGSGCITCNPTGPTAGDADWDFLVFTQEVVLAAAAEDQTVPEGAVVTLDGSTSSSPCGTLVYHWTQLAGDPVTLDLTDPVRPTFTAPFVPMGGAVLTFTLVVSDGVNTSEPDVVNITVTNINHAPVAMAGDDLCTETAVAEGGVATLDGSNSYDEDDEPLTYAWAQTGGTPVTLDLTDPVKPTFTAPLVGVLGETLTFELTVSDGLDGSSDTVDACVDNVNHAPIADAGEPQTVNEGSAVALHAGGSSDPDGDDLSYAWTQVSGPAVTLSDDSSATPSFTAPQVGASGATLVFRVTVDDGYGGSGDDEVTITVQDTNAPPACELARPSVAELWPPNHKLVAISIGGVSDPEDGDIQITILDVTQDEPTSGLGDGDTAPDAVIQGSTVLLRAERAGGGNGRVYRITFLADDGFGGTCTGAVTVTVPHDKGKNKPPAVDDGQNYSSTGP